MRVSPRLLIVLAAAAFGALAFFAEIALRAGVDPLTFLVVRFAVATGALAVVLARRLPERPSCRAAAAATFLGLVVYGGQSMCLTYALDRADASLVAVLFGTYPAMILIGTVALGSRATVRPVHAIAMTGVLVGVVLMVTPGGRGAPDGVAIALALASAALFATFVIASDRLVGTIDRVVLATLCCAGAGVTATITAIGTGRLDGSFGISGWWAMAAAGAVSTAFAFVAMFAALPRVGPATAGVVLGAEPVVTVLLSAAFLDETLVGLQVAGAVLVVLSVVLLQERSARAAPAGTL